MPRISSSLATVEDREPLPKATYRCRPTKLELRESKEAHNPMIGTELEVVEGEYKGRKTFTNIMIGGTQKDGQPMNTFMLMQFIDAFHFPWSCTRCNNPEQPRLFLRGTKENGLEKGKYFCPDCKAPASITYDTDIWLSMNKFADVAVDVEPSNVPDQERNVVKGFSAIA